MLKYFDLQVRRSGMDHAGFVAHWLNVHAPLSAAIANFPGYVINEVLEVSPAGSLAQLRIEPMPDGIAQLWFDSAQAMQVVTGTAEARRWSGDEVHYLGARAGIATVERVVSAPANKVTTATFGPAYKLIRLLQQRAELNASEFRNLWRGPYSSELQTLPHLRGFVQSEFSSMNPADDMPAIDVSDVSAIDELWFARHSEARQAALQLVNELAPATAALCESVCTLLISETTIIAPPR
jgi:hypothetical protein